MKQILILILILLGTAIFCIVMPKISFADTAQKIDAKNIPTTYLGKKDSGVLEHWQPLQLSINWNKRGEINDITLQSIKLQSTNGYSSSQPYQATEFIGKAESEQLLYYSGLGNALATVLDNTIVTKFGSDYAGGSYTNFMPKLQTEIYTNKIYDIGSNDVAIVTNKITTEILTNIYFKYY